MNTHSALVIFTNAYDIHIGIGKSDEDGALFSFGIYHGEAKRFRPIITSTPFAKTLEEVIEKIKEILVIAKDAASNILTDQENPVAQIINPGCQEIDQSLVLTDELIERILEELKNNKNVDTSTLVPVKAA
jgi:predicted RNase H-like HicB family nuclease